MEYMPYRERVLKWLKKYPLYEVEDLFSLAWRIVNNRPANKKENARISRDIAAWEDHLFVPTYVISYLRSK